MIAKKLNGEEVASHILKRVEIKAKNKRVQLAVIQVGENAISATYIKKKEEVAASLGIGFKLHVLSKSISQKKLESEIKKIAEKKVVSGVILQLPIPKHLNSQAAMDAIPLSKDVDVLSSEAFGKFTLGQFPILPPTVAAIFELLLYYKIPIKGKNVVIIGRGRLVGLPLTIFFQQQHATITSANSLTKNLSTLTRTADILISGVGKSGLVVGSMVKKGAVVIDAGTSVAKTQSLGDVDYKSVSAKASFISPVPGGVGPVTVACLFHNLVELG